MTLVDGLFSNSSHHGILSHKINGSPVSTLYAVLSQHRSHMLSPEGGGGSGSEAQVTDQSDVVRGVGHAGQCLVAGHLLVGGHRNHLIHLQDDLWD